MAYPVLEGKVAIITGAGQGMGEVTARLFAKSGAKVVIADFNRETGQKVADEIIAAGGDATFLYVDISKSDDVKALVEQTVERYGRLDCAVNNAALTPDQALISDFDEAYYDRLMAIDLKGTALCMKYELQQMIKQGDGGSIVNISSVSGFRPQMTTFAYTAAKAGVVGMTKTASMENGMHNIRVNSVAPGAINTPMLQNALVQFGLDPVVYAKQMSNLGRFAEPGEVAEASLWLCSDASSYVTGTTLHVDGGFVDAPPLG